VAIRRRFQPWRRGRSRTDSGPVALRATGRLRGGSDGVQIEGFLARPGAEGFRGGVVVIHHMPGFDRATREITRRFAEMGYEAICPNP